MNNIIWRGSYSTALSQYQDICTLFQAALWDKVIEKTDSVVVKISSLRPWLPGARATKRSLLVNLFMMKADALKKWTLVEDSWPLIVEHYEKAIVFLKDDVPGQTLFHCLFEISNLYLYLAKNKDIQFIVAALNYAVTAKNFAERIRKKSVIALSLDYMARCYSFSLPNNPIHNLDIAIDLFKAAHDIYLDEALVQEANHIKFLLAVSYYNRSIEAVSDIDREIAIHLLREIIEVSSDKNSDTNSDTNIAEVGYFLGKILLHGTVNFDKDSNKTAYSLLWEVLRSIDYEQNPVLWSETFVTYVKAAIGNKEVTFYLSSEEINVACSSVVDQYLVYFERIEKLDSFELRYDALYTKRKFLSLQGSYSYGDNLPALIALSNQVEGARGYDALWLEIQIAIGGEIYDSGFINKAVPLYENALQKMDVMKHPFQAYDVLLRLGLCYTELGRQKEALMLYEKAMHILILKKNDAGQRNKNLLRKMLYSSDTLFYAIPSLTLDYGDPVTALIYLEHLRYQPLISLLEELLLIEYQVNRTSLMHRYSMSRMAEKLLHTFDGPQREGNLDEFHQYFESIAALKKFHPELSEANFLNSLSTSIKSDSTKDASTKNDSIKQFDSWVLVPIVDQDRGKLVLIPPRELDLPVCVSHYLPLGVKNVMDVFTHQETGWLNHFIFKNLKDLTAAEDEKVDAAIETMESYLWESIGSWVHQVLVKNSLAGPIRLSVITQGAHVLLPLCMAANFNQEISLIDFAEISYAPSLYALFSLQERLKYATEASHMAFISSPPNNASGGAAAQGNTTELTYGELEKKWIESTFNNSTNGSFHSCQSDYVAIRKACSESTHWHFSSHGNFNWVYSQNSIIDVGGDKLEAGKLPILTSTRFLRLVVLSACESGIASFIDKEFSPESFLTEILKCGAIGAIGALWQVSDAVTALIFFRFYHLHITQKESPASALRKAQLWLRDINCKALCEFIELNMFNGEMAKIARELIAEIKAGNEDDHYPFAHPIHWAAFILVGQ